jgi:hypothetical protein
MKLIALLLLFPFFDFNQVEDPRLRRCVEAFIQEAEGRGVQLPEIHGLRIEFKVQSRDGAYWKADSLITISTAYKGTPKILELIVFHELGHAWLKLPHDDERTALMNSKPAPELWKKLRREYIDNLFLGTPVFR